MTETQSEIVVVGLGAMGSAALWRLAERGIRAVGFERFEPGHDRGSSHGESRIFRTAYIEGPGYVPLAQRAVALWRELQALSDVHLMTQNGALTLGLPTSSAITSIMASIAAHHLAYSLLDRDAAHDRYPMQRLSPGEVAVFEENAGFVRPERAIVAAVARAEQLGAQVFREAPVERIELESDGVRVITAETVCRARHAIVSVGAWLGKLCPELNLPLRVTRQTPGWYPIERPDLFAPERFPVFMRDIGEHSKPGEVLAPDSTFYGFPTLDGKTVKVAIHREGPLTDPDALDRTVAPHELERVQEYISTFLHGVGTTPVRTQVCMYTNTPDHDFVIGPPPGVSQLTVLGGFSGHGFKFAPIIGEVAADLATSGQTEHPVGFLAPSRFSQSASAS